MAIALREKVYPGDFLQLDSIETSVAPEIPTCYADTRRSNHKKEFEAAVSLYEALDSTEGSHRTAQLLDCRKFAWFAWHKETCKVKVIANACKLRWCPVCAESRQMHIREQVTAYIKTIRRPRLLTLTMSHSSDPLQEQVDRLYHAFRLLRKHRAIARLIRGGCWFFQIKKSKRDGCWHPHLHIILDSDYINKFTMSQEWFLTTGNSYIIDIRAITDPGKVADYVSRYCAKPCNLSDFTEADRIEVATVLYGKRICGSFGTGAKCRFASKPPQDAAMWQRIGNWTDIVIDRHNDPELRKVIECYQLGESLERHIFESVLRKVCGTQLPETAITVNPNLRQLCWESFVHL